MESIKMDDFKDILAQAISTEAVRGCLSSFETSVTELVELQCFQAIKDIRKILEDEGLEDMECFWKIEKIVCRLEALGLSCGDRHDFG